MKWNWGTGIVIGMAAFMIFILQYVIRVQIDDKYDNELVTTDYYQKEIHIDENYNAEKNALKLGENLNIKVIENGISINFPEEWKSNNINGTISLYRPSDQKLDHSLPIQLTDSNNLLIPKNLLAGGRWDISLSFNYENTSYLKKETLNL